MTPIYCTECDREYEELDEENNIWGCPVHDDAEQPKKRCRGCWKVKNCLLHHVSYIPEVTVPMCEPCHKELHSDSVFLSHLEPEMKRREALKKADSGFENGVAGWEPPAASDDVINEAFGEADL